jgi:hypothetical protein
MIQEVIVFVLIFFALAYLIRIFWINYFKKNKKCDGCAMSKVTESTK